MIDMVRDTWRALLVVATVALVCEIVRSPPAVATPSVATQVPPQPQYYVQPAPPPPPPRPLRRVAQAVVELAESVVGVVR